MIGFFIFSMVETNLDIIFTTFIANHFAKNLGHQHLEIINMILQYLKRLKKYKIIYDG